MPTLPQQTHGSLRSYSLGFLLSFLLTMAAYLTITEHWFSRSVSIPIIIGLSLLQLLVQLLFFLHLDRESNPRWNLLIFLFTVMVVSILVFGSLWIMNNLNYRMLAPAQLNQYILQQEGIPK